MSGPPQLKSLKKETVVRRGHATQAEDQSP
jgi:hypothetical protein